MRSWTQPSTTMNGAEWTCRCPLLRSARIRNSVAIRSASVFIASLAQTSMAGVSRIQRGVLRQGSKGDRRSWAILRGRSDG